MPDIHKNFAYSNVATAPSPAASGTSLVVTTGHGTRFPTVPFNATIWPVGQLPAPDNAEIVRVTGISTDTLTITRAQEGSSARTVVVGDQIAATITRKTFMDVYAAVHGICQGRLTLTSATPVTVADVTGGSAIFFTPYKGNYISLYDGTDWRLYSFSELSVSLSGLTTGKNYDVWIYDNAGTLTLEISAAWTNDTTRAEALALQDGVYVKSGVASRRYLGTFRALSATSTEDSRAKRLLWNYYNRAPRKLLKVPTADSWSYTTATWRQAGGDATNQVETVVGVSEEIVELKVHATSTNGVTSNPRRIAIGVDSTTVPSADVASNVPGIGWTAGQVFDHWAHLITIDTIGYHFFAWLEHSDAVNTTTWAGDYGGSNVEAVPGISGRVNG